MKSKGTIFFIDDNGNQKSTFYVSLDTSIPQLITFRTPESSTLITIPITRLLKIKQNGDDNE
jgi:hypothetical protein